MHVHEVLMLVIIFEQTMAMLVIDRAPSESLCMTLPYESGAQCTSAWSR